MVIFYALQVFIAASFANSIPVLTKKQGAECASQLKAHFFVRRTHFDTNFVLMRL